MNRTMLMRRLRAPGMFVVTLLLIEFLDEFVFGMEEAALPLIRNDLNLSYAQIGLLLALPSLIASFIEIYMGILADNGKRRILILGGGVVFAASCLLAGLSQSFEVYLIATIAFFPSSGAFVALSQATLMDVEPARHEQNMARWTLAGSIGILAGSLALSAALTLGGGWRELFILDAVLAFVLFLVVRRMRFPAQHTEADESVGFWQGFREMLASFKRPNVVRWLVLLELSDFMLDLLHAYLALYFVDVVGVSEFDATLAVAAWTGIGLIGDFLIIPLLERVRGLTYLRYSAAAEMILYPAFLLVPGFIPKLIIIALLGFCNAGWYAILQAQLYSSMEGQSGAVLSLNNIAGFVKPIMPLIMGLVATQFGLGAALWMLLVAPIALLVGLPRTMEDVALADD